MKAKNVLKKKKRKISSKFDIRNSLGTLILTFSTLEFTFKRVFNIITDIEEEISWAIITELGFSNFLNLLKDISKVKFKHNEKILNDITNIINKSKAVSIKRNLIIHSYWYNIPDDVKNIIHTFKPNKKLDLEVNKKSTEEIDNIINEIYQLQIEILKFVVYIVTKTIDKTKK